MKSSDDKLYAYLLILTMLLWGGGWSALKILTEDTPMPLIVFWRFFIMTLAFIPMLLYFKIKISLNLYTLRYIGGSAFLNTTFMVASYYGMKYGFAGSGSVIITTLSPVITFALMAFLFKNRVSRVQFIGLFIGLLGGIIMLQLDSWGHFINGANIFFLICAITWAGVTILAQFASRHIDPIFYSFCIALLSTIVAFAYLQSTPYSACEVFEKDSRFWIALIYLAVFGQSVATTIYFVASAKLGSQKSSSFMFLVPFFGVAVAWMLLDEALERHIILGGILSLLAVYLINFLGKKSLASK
ncbi:MAG: DMT family transporter [Epsilonproteobacteria bacterium]|nr:DMT family transporter [Campylobacterota bacterium]